MTKQEFKKVRTDKKLSRAEFADKLGLSIDSVISKELGRRPINKRDKILATTIQ